MNTSLIDRLAKRFLSERVRLPVRYARLRLALMRQGIRDLRQVRHWARPLPPPLLRYRVQGSVSEIAPFMITGLNCAQNVRSALGRRGARMEEFGRILDFGCGCARILRWFQELPERCRLYGTDLDGRAVEWCRRAFPRGDFQVNGPHPPLAYDEGFFDLVLGLSVLCHLDESFQEEWIGELSRITRKGGLVLLSFLCSKADGILGGEDKARLMAKGFLFKQGATGPFKPDGLPDCVQLSFQSRKHATALCERRFLLLDYIEGGLHNFQDLLVLQKI